MVRSVYVVGICKRCGYISSQPLCKACVLLEGLNKGLPRYKLFKLFTQPSPRFKIQPHE